jgi:hypothetical protein
LNGDSPVRLHVQFGERQDIRADEGRRVATIRPDHFRENRTRRKLWLDRGDGFLVLFKADGTPLDRQRIRPNRNLNQKTLQNAARNDEIGVLEALACLQAHNVQQDAYAVAATWEWHVAPVIDALTSPLSLERAMTLRFLRAISSNFLDALCQALIERQVHPNQLGQVARDFANLLKQKAYERSYVDQLLGRLEWQSLLDVVVEPDITWTEDKLREAIQGSWDTPEWRSALQMTAEKMPVARAFDLLLGQTHRAALDQAARAYLFRQLTVLIRRFQVQDLQTYTVQLSNDLINRSGFSLEERSTLLSALLSRADQLAKMPHPPRSDEPQQIKRWLYSFAQPIQTWCQAALQPQPPALESAQLAARAASLCQNPQLQGVLMTFLERTERLPAAQAALFKALGDLRAEETGPAEPLAQRLAKALRNKDANGLHEAAIHALERFQPHENSRCILELIRDALRGRIQYTDVPRLVRLIATHALFDLNNIATDALIESAISRDEWRQAIIETWRKVPDPHFVRGALIRDLPRNAALRQSLHDAVPSDADFAPLRDWLEALDGFAALRQTQNDLLENLRQIANLLNDISPGNVRAPERLGDINSFLSDARAHIQALDTQLNALDREISTIIQQRGAYSAQTVVFSTVSAALGETERMLQEQLEMLKAGIRVSDEQIRLMQDQLQRLRREQNLSGEVGDALQQVNTLLENIRSDRTDLNEQRRSVENALKQTRDKKNRLEEIRRRHDQSDPSAPEIERLTARRAAISAAIDQLDQRVVDEINNTIRFINDRRAELQTRRDDALNAWMNNERMTQHRQRLQAHLADERRRRMAELRAYRQSPESRA